MHKDNLLKVNVSRLIYPYTEPNNQYLPISKGLPVKKKLPTDEGIGIVIEVKYLDSSVLANRCLKALEQIERMGYEDKLRRDGLTTIYKYGIACHKKQCKVLLQE